MRISDWSSDVCSSDLREAEIGVDTELRLLKLARQRGIEQCEGHLDRHARAGAMLAAGPARVDQPTIDPPPGNTPAQMRLEERRVGQVCVSTCRTLVSRDHKNKNKNREIRKIQTKRTQ